MDILKQASNYLVQYGEANSHDDKNFDGVSGSAIASGSIKSEAHIINPEVHNYRLLKGTGTHGVKYIHQVLQYSRSLPLIHRGVSILVVDQQNQKLLQQSPPDYPEAQPLKDQLLGEGVQIMPLESFMDYAKKHYPRTLKLLDSLRKLPLKPDTPEMSGEEAHNNFESIVLSMILPDYAFSQNKDGQLKTVTVAHPGLLSSLFLPATVQSNETADILETSIWPDKTQKRYLFDGRGITRLIHSLPDSTATGNNRNKISIGPMLVFAPDVFSLTSSVANAKKRAAVIEEISNKYLAVPLFSTKDLFIIKEDRLIDMEPLEDYVHLYKDQNVNVCFSENIEYGNQTTSFNVRCADKAPEVLRFFRLIFSKYFNNQYSIPRLKDLAHKHNIEWHHNYFDSIDQTSGFVPAGNSTSGYRFNLYAPDIFFYAREKNDLERFVGKMALDAETASIKYLFTDYFRDFGFPPGISDGDSPCHPLLNVSYLSRLSLPISGEQEMSVYQERINSYPPGAKYCIPSSLRQEDSCSQSSAYQSMSSGFQYGMLAGFLNGLGSHCNRPYLFRNPFISGALGYATSGLLGAALGVGSYFANRLPDCLRRGALPGSWRSRSAMIIEAANTGLPLLMGGISNYTGAVVGGILGKYSTEVALDKLRPREVRQPCPDSSDSPGRSRRAEKSRRTPAMHTKIHTNEAVPEKKASTLDLLKRLVAEYPDSIAGTSDGSEQLQQMIGHTTRLLSKDDNLTMLEESTLEKLADILPWSQVDDVKVKVVINYATRFRSQDKTVYLQKECEKCEAACDGLSAAVRRFPGLYLNYLKSYSGAARIDGNWLDNLWKVLDSGSDETLLVETGKKVISNSSENNKTKAGESLLLDDKLSHSARLAIIKGQSSDFQQQLCQGEVLKKLGIEHLKNVVNNPKGRKQNESKHIRNAIDIWVKGHGKQLLSDNLIYLLIEFLPENGDDTGQKLREDFRNKLRTQVSKEITSTDVTKRIRAEAVKIQDQTSRF